MKKHKNRNSSTNATIDRRPTDRERYLELQLEAAQSEVAQLREKLNGVQTEFDQLCKELGSARQEINETSALLEAAKEKASRRLGWVMPLCLGIGMILGAILMIWLWVHEDYERSHAPLDQVVTTTESEDLAIRGLCQTLYNEVNYDLARALILKMNEGENLFVIRDEAAFGEAYLETRWLKETELWLRMNFEGYYQYTRNNCRYTILIEKPKRPAFPEPAPADDDSFWAATSETPEPNDGYTYAPGLYD